MADKRVIHPMLKRLLLYDALITDKFCSFVNKYLPFQSLRKHYKALEISCHGLPWLVGWLAFIWILNKPSLFEVQVNFYLGLILDIFCVAVLKAVVRRRRPFANTNDMFLTIGPDHLSFPSGHASRAVFIAHFFICLCNSSVFFWPPLVAWCASICISRVLLRRHHLLDVLAGVVLGIFESNVIGFFWLDKKASIELLSWLTDENLSDTDYQA